MEELLHQLEPTGNLKGYSFKISHPPKGLVGLRENVGLIFREDGWFPVSSQILTISFSINAIINIISLTIIIIIIFTIVIATTRRFKGFPLKLH